MHTMTRVEVRDLSVFWAGHTQLAYATQLYHTQCRWCSNAIEIYGTARTQRRRERNSERRRLKLTHAWQLRIMIDKGRQATQR